MVNKILLPLTVSASRIRQNYSHTSSYTRTQTHTRTHTTDTHSHSHTHMTTHTRAYTNRRTRGQMTTTITTTEAPTNKTQRTPFFTSTFTLNASFRNKTESTPKGAITPSENTPDDTFTGTNRTTLLQKSTTVSNMYPRQPQTTKLGTESQRKIQNKTLNKLPRFDTHSGEPQTKPHQTPPPAPPPPPDKTLSLTPATSTSQVPSKTDVTPPKSTDRQTQNTAGVPHIGRWNPAGFEHIAHIPHTEPGFTTAEETIESLSGGGSLVEPYYRHEYKNGNGSHNEDGGSGVDDELVDNLQTAVHNGIGSSLAVIPLGSDYISPHKQ